MHSKYVKTTTHQQHLKMMTVSLAKLFLLMMPSCHHYEWIVYLSKVMWTDKNYQSFGVMGNIFDKFFACVISGSSNILHSQFIEWDWNDFQYCLCYHKSLTFSTWIDNLDQFIFVIKIWPNDVYPRCVWAKVNTLDQFLTHENMLIDEEHKKFIENRGLFEKDFDFDWMSNQ